MSNQELPLAGDRPSGKGSGRDAVAALPGQPSSQSEPRFTSYDLVLALALSALIGVAYFPIIRNMANGNVDYGAHADVARQLVESGVLIAPACLLHILVAALVQVGLAGSYLSAELGVVVGSHAAVAGLLYLSTRWIFLNTGLTVGRVLPASIALLFPFVQPAVSWSSRYRIGYIWAEPYHSPTYALLKPFALVGAVLAVYFLMEYRKSDGKLIGLCAIAVAAGTLAKPSFTICAVPAIGLCAALQYIRRKPFSRIAVLFGWILPALAVLVWQYARTYTSPSADRYTDKVIFAPLAVMRTHTDNIAAPYFWSVLLPLCVFAVYRGRAWDDTGLRFSAIAFLFGTLYTYTLAEQLRLAAGNFTWSAYITLFLLYLFSVIFIARQITESGFERPVLIRAAPCVAVLAWHLSSGLAVHSNYLRAGTFRYIPPQNDGPKSAPADRHRSGG